LKGEIIACGLSYSYEIMLECWQEHPLDRPGFSLLRSKFSNLLLATTGDTYMELEVDDSKVYYTMGDEEEKGLKGRRASVSSTDSDSSVKKEKKPKKIEKPKWAQNPYVPTPSTFKEDHMHIDDEHYRVQADVDEDQQQPDENIPRTMSVVVSTGRMASSAQTPPSRHAPLAGSLSSPAVQIAPEQTNVHLEDQMGIPLSFISRDKHAPAQSKQSNPYVEDPSTNQPLSSEGGAVESPMLGSLSLELSLKMRGTGNGQSDNTTSVL
jgi:hypothetical protein